MRMLAALVSFALASAASAADPAPAAPADAATKAPAAMTSPVTATTPAPTPTAVTPAAAAPGYGKTSGLIPGVLIGPKLHLIGVPPGFGVEARVANAFSFSLDYVFVPTIKVPGAEGAEAKLSWGDFSGAARWHPWHASFYLGAALGTRSFKASAKDSVAGATATASAEVSSTYLAPEIGWRWIWGNGFFLGMDLGYQIILSSKTTLNIPALGVSAQNKQDVTDAADQIGKVGLPILSLLQLGFYL